MTKATVAKLTVIIIIAFIVCLPEFFPSQVLQIQFLCAPFDPCDLDSLWNHNDVRQIYADAPSGFPLPRCAATNTTNPEEAVKRYFLCETGADLRSVWSNASVSGEQVEVLVLLQISDPDSLQTVSVRAHLNKSGLYIGTRRDVTPIACCCPDRANGTRSPSERSHTNRSSTSCCLFHLHDVQTMSPHAGRLWSVGTIVWLVLVLLVVVLVLLGVRDQVFKNRRCCQKGETPARRPVNHAKSFSKRRVKSLGDLPDDVSALNAEDGELFLEKTPSDCSRAQQRRVSLPSTEMFLQVVQDSYRRGLSPIPELCVTRDGSLRDEYDEEASYDGVNSTEAFLHHRSHPSLPSCH